jgi:hypothetical protein
LYGVLGRGGSDRGNDDDVVVFVVDDDDGNGGDEDDMVGTGEIEGEVAEEPAELFLTPLPTVVLDTDD